MLRILISVTLVVVAGIYAATFSAMPNLSRISVTSVAAISFALTTTIFLAAVRLQYALADLGQSTGFRDCLVATALGNAAGYIIFQIIGQIAARSAVLGKVGVSAEISSLATVYERIVALGVSAAMAIAGGIYVFGHIAVDLRSGGQDFLTLVISLVVVFLIVAATAWRDLIIENIVPLLTMSTIKRATRLAAVTVLIQGTTLIAFVLATRQFSDAAPISDLIAASAIVMFAAAIPISFAGWGVRELSAVAALGVIGISAAAALSASVMIGVLSLLTVCLVASGALMFTRKRPALAVPVASTDTKQWQAAASWTFPLATALFAFFQIRAPIVGGYVNLSPADLVVTVVGTLLAFRIISEPELRAQLRPALWLCSIGAAIFVISYLNGLMAFGSNQWAGAKLIGGLLLLSYAGAGATIALYAGPDGIRRMALTMLVTCCGIIGVSTFLNFGHGLLRVEGFAGNTNAFAFQIIICFAVGVAMLRHHRAWPIAAAILVFGVLQTGSRSGAGTLALVMLATLGFRLAAWRAMAFAAIVGVGTSLLVSYAGPAITGASGTLAETFQLRPSSELAVSDNERWRTIADAFDMFRRNPIFGAGFGYYFEHFKRPDGGPLVIHSSIFWVLGEMGLTGLATLAAIAILMLKRAASFAWRGNDTALLLVLTGITFIVMGSVHDMFYQRTFWLALGLSVPIFVRSYASSASSAS
jgi:O-antigen ligase